LINSIVAIDRKRLVSRLTAPCHAYIFLFLLDIFTPIGPSSSRSSTSGRNRTTGKGILYE
jgi:hypothetical protein